MLNVAECRGTILSEKAGAAVSPEKLAASLKFRFEKDRLRALGGELLARMAVRRKLGLKNEDINFSKGPFGKPFLKGFDRFHFNVSHSGELAICAVSSFEIGCDCELIDADNNFDDIRNVFCKNELASIDSLSGIDRTIKCYDIWTAKESFIKCTGLGLGDDVSKLEVYRENEVCKIRKNGLEMNYFIKHYKLLAGYAAAVCSPSNNFPERAFIARETDLLL